MNTNQPIINTSDVMICHGMVEHSLVDSWKCDDCREIKQEFDETMSSGEIQKLLDSIQ